MVSAEKKLALGIAGLLLASCMGAEASEHSDPRWSSQNKIPHAYGDWL